MLNKKLFISLLIHVLVSATTIPAWAMEENKDERSSTGQHSIPIVAVEDQPDLQRAMMKGANYGDVDMSDLEAFNILRKSSHNEMLPKQARDLAASTCINLRLYNRISPDEGDEPMSNVEVFNNLTKIYNAAPSKQLRDNMGYSMAYMRVYGLVDENQGDVPLSNITVFNLLSEFSQNKFSPGGYLRAIMRVQDKINSNQGNQPMSDAAVLEVLTVTSINSKFSQAERNSATLLLNEMKTKMGLKATNSEQVRQK